MINQRTQPTMSARSAYAASTGPSRGGIGRPTAVRSTDSTSLASIYRALVDHERRQRHPDAVAAAPWHRTP